VIKNQFPVIKTDASRAPWNGVSLRPLVRNHSNRLWLTTRKNMANSWPVVPWYGPQRKLYYLKMFAAIWKLVVRTLLCW